MADKIVHGERRGTAGAGWAARCWPGWPGPRGLIPLVGLLALATAELGRAQTPTIEARKRAHQGPEEDRDICEPAVAPGPNEVITVFHVLGDGVKYAIYDTAQEEWVADGDIHGFEGGDPHDPSIAYGRNPYAGGFIAAARTNVRVMISHFDPELGQFEDWVSLADTGGPWYGYDKPWIVAGRSDLPTGQEYFIVTQKEWAGVYGLLRSTDGGENWAEDEIWLFCGDEEKEEPVTGTFCAQPGIHEGGPLYIAYNQSAPPSIHFISGDIIYPADGDGESEGESDGDPPESPCANTGVYFEPLCDSTGERLTLPLNRVKFHGPTYDYLPGAIAASTVPQLAVDPSNANRLYIVYHDTEDDTSHDVNVYMNVLTRTDPYWTLGPRLQVNETVTQYESDQFLPSIAVDYAGRINIMYYDDQKHTDPTPGDPDEDQQPDGFATPKFDVFYAYSKNQGVTWGNEELFADPPEAALNWELQALDPFEYNGIAWYGDTVWTTYTGTHYDAVPETYDAVISSSRIDWIW